jgi:hypothetical protein
MEFFHGRSIARRVVFVDLVALTMLRWLMQGKDSREIEPNGNWTHSSIMDERSPFVLRSKFIR